MKLYTTLGYIVSLILLNLGHVINVINYCLTRWTFFSELTHTADDAKAKHVSQVQED